MNDGALTSREELVGLIYDAVVCPEAWQTFIEKLVAGTRSRSGLLILQNTENLDIAHTLQDGFDPSTRSEYNRDFRDQDLWVRTMTQLPRETFYPSRAGLPQKLFRRSCIYNEFCKPLDIEHAAAAFLSTEGPWAVRVSLQRTKRQGEFSDVEIGGLQSLVPHLRRGLMLGRELCRYRGDFEATMAQLTMPCLLLNQLRRVVAINASARHLIATHPGLTVRNDALLVKAGSIAQRVDSLIQDCLQTLSSGQGQGGGYVTLPREDRLPLIMSVIPFRGGIGAEQLQGGATVAVLFYDPERRQPVDVKLFMDVYGLTQTEAQVAALLAAGRNTREIAHARQVSGNAIKYHLKSIYAKTGTHRQGELVSLLLALVAQVPASIRPADRAPGE